MQYLTTLIAGIVFGLGLVISGMVNPAKVQNFLDIFGTWDPSLVFVIGGAIAVTMPGYWLLKRRNGPLFSETFQFPTRKDIDRDLVLGAAIFGFGWGIGGYCPGPAITGLSLGNNSTFIFVGAMILGMVVAKVAARRFI